MGVAAEDPRRKQRQHWVLTACRGRLTMTGRTLHHNPSAVWKRLVVLCSRRSAPDLPGLHSTMVQPEFLPFKTNCARVSLPCENAAEC